MQQDNPNKKTFIQAGVVGLAVAAIVFLMLGPNKLPGCNDSETLELTSEILNQLAPMLAANVQVAEYQNISEAAYDPAIEERICKATAISSSGGTAAVAYLVRWANQAEGTFIVEAELI